MVSGMVYQSLRLYTYGKLASALLNVDVSGLNESRDEWNRRHPGEPWKTMLPYRKVSMYSAWVFRRYAKPWLTLKVLAPSGQRGPSQLPFLSNSFRSGFLRFIWTDFRRLRMAPFDVCSRFCSGDPALVFCSMAATYEALADSPTPINNPTTGIRPRSRCQQCVEPPSW